MYWYKRYSPITWGFLVLLATVTACRPEIKESGSEKKYFDLAGFIKADTARLNKLNPTIEKSVSHNGQTETKRVKIANWGYELDLFASSDINKPSWRASYKSNTAGNITTYTALTPQLKTREIVVEKDGARVRDIRITNHTKNLLYETTEKLVYYPDSLYRIDKIQHVLLLGDNRYLITGKFVK